MTAQNNKPNIVRVERDEPTANKSAYFYKITYDRNVTNDFIATTKRGDWRWIIASDELDAWQQAQATLDVVYGKD